MPEIKKSSLVCVSVCIYININIERKDSAEDSSSSSFLALAGGGEQAEPPSWGLHLAGGINSGPNLFPDSQGGHRGGSSKVLEWLRTESLERVKLHSENIYFYT